VNITALARLIPLFALIPSLAVAAVGKTTNFTTEQKTQIEEIVHQYLLAKPEVIVEAMQKMQQQQMQQTQKTIQQTQETAPKFANALFLNANDPIAGDPNGNVTVAEFFDYQCGHCVHMASVLENVSKANPHLKIVFKEFPIRGPMSEMAAKAALAANKQGKYLAMHHALMGANQPLTAELIFQLAQTAGVDVEKMKKDMDDPAISKTLKDTYQLGQDLKLFATPAFFIGKTQAPKTIKYLLGAMEQKQMQDIVDEQGKA